MATQTTDFALMLTARVEPKKYSWQDGDTWRGKAELVRIEDGSPRNIQNSWYEGTMGFEGLYADAAVSEKYAATEDPGGCVWFQPIGERYGSAEMAEMGKVAARVNRAMAKAYNSLGGAPSFGFYILRLAKALGVKQFIIATPYVWGGSYPDMKWQFLTASEAGRWMDEQFSAYRATLAPVFQPA